MEWIKRWQSRSPAAAEAVRRGVTAASEFVTKELGPAAHSAEETPDVAMQEIFRFHKTGRFPIGESLARGGWSCTEPKQHLLAVAPTQSHAGKTSGIIIPHILAHPGPVVAVTTKADVFPATAMARAQAGRLWCYCPDGVTDHIPEGVTELRWSPIKGAGEWDVAIRTARTMVTVVDKESMRHGSHWQSRAGDLLAPIFHWAVRSHRTMRQARDAVYDHATSLPAIERWLTENGAPAAGALLRSVIHAAPTELASIASTAAGALAAYSTEAAMRTTDGENFDIADFVNGGTGRMRADTIYIAPTTGSQRELAPLIVGLLSHIQAAAYQRQRKIVRNELVGHPAAGPILFALDELYGLAPMPDLPHLLSEGGSQGIHVTAAVQDLTLIGSRWPDEAASFMTLFGHILFFPGIRDDATLQKVSGLLGHHDVEKRSETRKNVVTGGGIQEYLAGREQQWTERVENITYSTEWRPRYEKHDIQMGPVPEDPDCAFHLYPGGWEAVRLHPYYRGQRWPLVVTGYFDRALRGRVPEWRWWESHYSLSPARPDIPDTLPSLPVPPLRPWAERTVAYPPSGAEGAWAQRFLDLITIRNAILAKGSRQARWEIHEPHARPWCVTHRLACLETSPETAVPQGHPPAPSGSAPVSSASVPPQGSAAAHPPRAVEMPAASGGLSPEERERVERNARRRPEGKPGTRALAIHVLGPVTHFPFEDIWTLDVDSTMLAPTMPPAFWEVYAGMLRAIEEEKRRRRARGDDASVERFEREWTWIIDAEEHDPAFREQFEAEQRIIRNAPMNWGTVGWWARIAPPETRCIQAFLRGDDVDVTRRATPPRTEGDDTGRAVPVWTARGSTRGAGSAISVLGPVTHYTFEEPWTREAHEVMLRREDTGELGPERALSLTRGGMERALNAEKDRRHACGDHGSVERFERRRNTFYEANKPPLPGEDDPAAGADWQEEWRIVKAAPDNWPDAGYWTWIAPPQVRLFQAFLRGDPIDGDPVLADLPITHFPFEEMWTGEDQEAMHARNDDDPFPPAYQRMWDGLEGALFKETMRRRAIGDEASVDELDRERRRISEARKDPAFMEQLRAQHQEARRSCPHWGWWMWMQVPLVLVFQRYLRGEPIGAAAAAAVAAGKPHAVSPDDTRGATSPAGTHDALAPAPPAGAAGGTAAAPEFIAHFPFEEGWTDDDHTAMSESDDESVPFAHRRVLAGMELAILAEKRRRRAGGDMASVASFEQERTAVETRYGEDPAFKEECRAERITVLETTGRQWGWWIWQPVPVVRLIQGFLLGEPSGAGDVPPPEGGAPPYPPVAPREQVTAAAAAELGLDSLSITHFPFEVPWTPADDDVMQTAGRTGPRPPAWDATIQGLAEALAGEKARRTDAGDAVSVERFDLGWTRWTLESGRNPAFGAECSNESLLAAVYSGEEWGFWKYWPLVQVQGIQAFLRGEPVADAYVAGPAAPTPPVHLFPFEEPWSFEDDVYMTLHPEGPYPPAWDAVMQGSGAPIRAEKARREAARDTHSLRRFEAGLARSGREVADPGAMAAAEEERAAAAARGEDWTKSFWWWTPDVPLALLTIAFLRGEPLREPHAQGPTTAPAEAGVLQTAPAPQTDSPECWEPQWGKDEIAELRQWKRGGAPPDALMDTISGMNAAMAREKERRRRTGDGASVERFEREMEAAREEARSGNHAWRDELFAAIARREKVRFWDCMPPRTAEITRRFLRGEDAATPHDHG